MKMLVFIYILEYQETNIFFYTKPFKCSICVEKFSDIEKWAKIDGCLLKATQYSYIVDRKTKKK